jgi:hypothetical protein
MTIRLPLADLKTHGAELIDNGNTFGIKAKSGAVLGNFALPPEPILLEFESAITAPVSAWAPQKSIEMFAEFDAGMARLKADDSISEVERMRRRLKLVEKAQAARDQIESRFAEAEAEVVAAEKAHYSWQPLPGDDIVGALRDNEIRTALRSMSEEQLAPILRSLNEGLADRAVIEAVLRAPFPMGRLSDFAQNGWRALRDKEDPLKRAAIDTVNSRNDWGRRIVGAVQGTLSGKLRDASKLAAA